ncbi:MAG: hypothetical protein IJ446_02960 [Oscillospiraceae bacterium]|nr:hypothetical protein [Oscillospiraceae bacterium]
MGLFDFFRKKNAVSDAMKGKKTKTINYVAADISQLADDMDKDVNALLKLAPVNYYAIKNTYIEAFYIMNEELDDISVAFSLIETKNGAEKPTAKTGLYQIDFELYRKAMLKVGVTVKRNNEE